MCRIEVFVILAVTPFNLAVVTWCSRTNQLMPDPVFLKALFKQRKRPSRSRQQAFGELSTIVGLDALDLHRECIDEMIEKDG